MISRVLLVLISLVSLAAIPPQGINVRAQTEFHARMLEAKVSNARNNTERFRALHQALDQISSLRENNLTFTGKDEGYVSLMVSVLESLPTQTKFRQQDCAKYENDFLNQFEPTADEQPKEPAVRPGWKVLQALCRQ